MLYTLERRRSAAAVTIRPAGNEAHILRRKTNFVVQGMAINIKAGVNIDAGNTIMQL